MNQTIHHGSAFDLDPAFVSRCDVLLTDPPYSKHVHASAISQSKVRGTRKRDLGFESLTVKTRRAVANWASLVKRWSVIYSDVESANWLALSAQARGVEYIRTMPWIRWSMPQLTGDRPPQGSESLVVLHPKGKKHWNGPGNLTHFSHLALRGEGKHKCEKPLDQALDLVSYFSDPDETVLDPFAGSGSIGLACRLLDRNYIGVEIDAHWATFAQARLGGALSDRDTERLTRWLAADSEPVSALAEGPSVLRAQARAADKERIRKHLTPSCGMLERTHQP